MWASSFFVRQGAFFISSARPPAFPFGNPPSVKIVMDVGFVICRIGDYNYLAYLRKIARRIGLFSYEMSTLEV